MSVLLHTIHKPEDIKRLNQRELDLLAQEVRKFLIRNVSKTGGHLSSNLGVVELTIALHHCYHSPQDQFVFDVGHQCYTHKILTGRMGDFPTLRKAGGLSGFPNPKESCHDIFKAGHGSTSISVAIGLAQAKKIKNEPGKVIVVIGDGAFTGGMIYEGLNNIGGLDNLMIVLNDNKMSISKNVGGLAQYFTKLRTNPKYSKAKQDVKFALEHTPVIGDGITKGIQSFKKVVRRSILHSTFFEELGLQYVGPVDGHNIAQLCSLFDGAKQSDRPVFVHLDTVKGKGYSPAERNPGAYHGVSSLNLNKIQDPDVSSSDSFSTVFGDALVEVAEKKDTICAITAAMKHATGLYPFRKTYPERFFDVGMAEQHAVTFSAGLAAGGMAPVCAIYSTFLQRAYDQIIHDVMLSRQDVLFAIDRAGLVPGDGETHQGIYDVAFLSQQKEMPIVSPSNYNELRYWLEELLLNYKGPRSIRYSRGKQPASLAERPATGKRYDLIRKQKDASIALVSYGTLLAEVLKASSIVAKQGLATDVYQMVWVNPLEEKLVEELLAYKHIIFAEETVAHGGVGEHLALRLMQKGYKGSFTQLAVPETGIDHAEVDEIRAQVGLDGESIAKKINLLEK